MVAGVVFSIFAVLSRPSSRCAFGICRGIYAVPCMQLQHFLCSCHYHFAIWTYCNSYDFSGILTIRNGSIPSCHGMFMREGQLIDMACHTHSMNSGALPYPIEACKHPLLMNKLICLVLFSLQAKRG